MRELTVIEISDIIIISLFYGVINLESCKYNYILIVIKIIMIVILLSTSYTPSETTTACPPVVRPTPTAGLHQQEIESRNP